MTTSRSVLGLVRSLHVYLSGLALALFLFIAVTGFVLNHGARFGLDDPQTQTQALTLPTAALVQPDKPLIERELRQRLGSLGQMDSFEIESEDLRITFKKPGSRTDAVVDRASGEATVTTEDRGKLGVLTDLHKGASAGNGWTCLIDSAAILLTFVSLTGLVLLLSLPRWRWLGVGLIIVGLGAAVVSYAIFVA